MRDLRSVGKNYICDYSVRSANVYIRASVCAIPANKDLAGRGVVAAPGVVAAAQGGIGKAFLAEHRQRLHAGFQRPQDHVGALGDEAAATDAATQLRFGPVDEAVRPRHLQRRYLNKVHRYKGSKNGRFGNGLHRHSAQIHLVALAFPAGAVNHINLGRITAKMGVKCG